MDRSVSADTRFMVPDQGLWSRKGSDRKRESYTRKGGSWQNVAAYERNARYKYAARPLPSCVGG